MTGVGLPLPFLLPFLYPTHLSRNDNCRNESPKNSISWNEFLQSSDTLVPFTHKRIHSQALHYAQYYLLSKEVAHTLISMEVLFLIHFSVCFWNTNGVSSQPAFLWPSVVSWNTYEMHTNTHINTWNWQIHINICEIHLKYKICETCLLQSRQWFHTYAHMLTI